MKVREQIDEATRKAGENESNLILQNSEIQDMINNGENYSFREIRLLMTVYSFAFMLTELESKFPGITKEHCEMGFVSYKPPKD